MSSRAMAFGIFQWNHYVNRRLGGSRMFLGKRIFGPWRLREIKISKTSQIYCDAATSFNLYHAYAISPLVSLMTRFFCKCVEIRTTAQLLQTNFTFALKFLGGTAASEPFPRQLATHLCELDPKGRSMAGLPRGKAKGGGPRTGCRTSHQTWRCACAGARAGE